MDIQIYFADILYSQSPTRLISHKDSYLVVENGIVEGIYPALPEKYKDIPVTDYKGKVIIPAFSDLHVHASQYVERGLGMDCLLRQWLNDYTFPQEAKFADLGWAKDVYDAFVKDMVTHGTFHSSIFATIHRPATDYLFEKMAQKGLYGFVGKVNMDINSPDFLCEDTRTSLKETEEFLSSHPCKGNLQPIITPRFAPTCSPKLMEGLGKLAKKYGAGLQTHVVESKWEAARALEIFGDCSCDSEIYQKSGLLENGPSVFAHVIFPSEKDISIMKKYNVAAVHCPDAANNVIAGIMPLDNMLSQGVNITMGSDVGGGHHLRVYKQIAKAVQLSKLKEFYEPQGNKAINFATAFYCATKAGGSVFGKVGSFEKGYTFNALVIDSMEDKNISLSPREKAERFCYIGDDRNIAARFIQGRFITP